jgi:hypothetical protein
MTCAPPPPASAPSAASLSNSHSRAGVAKAANSFPFLTILHLAILPGSIIMRIAHDIEEKGTAMNSTLSTRLDRIFLTCPAVAAMCASVAQKALADVHYSGIVNINIPSTVDGVYLNVVTGQNSSNAGLVPGWDLNPWGFPAIGFDFYTPPTGFGAMVGSGTTYFNLELGTLVSAASTFTQAGTTTPAASTPLNLNSSSNYMGFRFINEANGNAVNYGWIQVQLAGTPAGQPRSIVAYAWEDSGGGIIVGAPAPGALSLLGVGLAGFNHRRRTT